MDERPPAVLKRATSEHDAHVLAQEDSVPPQFVDAVLDDGQSPSPKLQLLVCHTGGRVGGAFKRLMLLTAMHGAYRSRSGACHSFKYRETKDHHYQTVWVLDDFGVKNLDEVISYAKSNIVALFKPNPTDIISGAPLPPSAFHGTRETRLRAVFALGATPLAMLIDERLHSEAQLLIDIHQAPNNVFSGHSSLKLVACPRYSCRHACLSVPTQGAAAATLAATHAVHSRGPRAAADSMAPVQPVRPVMVRPLGSQEERAPRAQALSVTTMG